MRALLIKIKAITEDETLSEDEGIALDTRKVERIRLLLNQFYKKYRTEMEA